MFIFERQKLLLLSACLFLMSASFSAQAASTITFDQINPSFDFADGSFTIKVIGTGFDSGTSGGGFDLAWDSAILKLDSVLMDANLPNDFFSELGVIDNNAGTLTGFNSGGFFESLAGPDFDIATLSFSFMGSGNSTLDLQGNSNVWADAFFAAASPTFVDTNITVKAVPVPAAAWLFASGLAGLGFTKRKQV